MGTSADYGGGTGGAWTPYKTAINTFAKHGPGSDGVRTKRVVSRYVAARGGAAAISQGAGAASAARAAQELATLVSGVAVDGLTPALERLGYASLVGKDRYELMDALVEAFAGDGSTLDDQAVLSAVIATLELVFPEDAESYEQLAETQVDAADVPRIVETLLAEWAFYDMAPTFAEKLTHIEDPAVYLQREADLRQILGNIVKIKLGDRDPAMIDWAAADGRQIVESAIADAFSIMEDEPS
ncbi:MAG: hypothetical protein PGN13_01280 [Patulibacter minatonensis]